MRHVEHVDYVEYVDWSAVKDNCGIVNRLVSLSLGCYKRTETETKTELPECAENRNHNKQMDSRWRLISDRW